MNKVIIFSAPSGSGKTTLVKHCLEHFPELEFSISCTTRNPRGTEKDGVDYHFISPEKFRQKIWEEAFVEFEEVYEDKYYGTLKSEVERIWNDGKTVIFDVDVKGGIALKKY
ncbi:MAG TPA: guanylate kinase, partial [Chryseobacterium sp.]|nr:guanylate kinase [Chryseobacterium sp.]